MRIIQSATSWKRLVLQRNGPKLGLWGKYLCVCKILWPLNVQGESEVIFKFLLHRVFFPIFDKFVCWNQLIVDWNGRKFGPRGNYSVYTENIWLLSVQSHSEVIRCILYFLLLSTAPRSDGPKLGPVVSFYCRQGIFLYFSRSLWGHSVHFRFFSEFQQLCMSKTVGHSAKRTKIWAYWALFIVYDGYFKYLRIFWSYSVHSTFDNLASRKCLA